MGKGEAHKVVMDAVQMYKDIYPESKLDWLFYYIEAKFKFQLIFFIIYFKYKKKIHI